MTTSSAARTTVGGASSNIMTMDDVKSSQAVTTSSLGNYADKSTTGAIPQSERLFTLRPRSTPLSNDTRYTSDRGPYASIKLITDRDQTSVMNQVNKGDSATTKSLDYVVGQLLNSGYSDFLLTGVSTALDEKVQITEVFGDSEVVYYFGKSPVIFSLDGILTDDVDNNWFYNFLVAYGNVLRGTQLAKNYQLVKINLPNATLVGTISSLRYSQQSTQDVAINFQMSIIVKTLSPRPVTIPSELLSNDAIKINLALCNQIQRFQDKAQINEIKRQLNNNRAYLGSTLGSTSAGKFFTSLGDSIANTIDSGKGFFDSISTGLFSVAELRANIFAPVYGVLTTLTKIVQSLTGDISHILGVASSPLTSILRDVRTISNEAVALINAIEGGIGSIVRNQEMEVADIRKTIRALQNTSGMISRAPEDISNILKRMTKLGRKKGAIASLKSGKVSKSKAALLNSGTPYNPSSGATING